MHTEVFSSVSAFLDRINEPTDFPERNRNTLSYPSSWNGNVTLPQAIHLANYGWEEGLAEAEKFITRLTTTLTGMIKQPELIYDVVGDNIDIGRVLSGLPEDFMSIVDSAVTIDANPAKLVRVVCNIGATSNVDPESVIIRGAAMVALVHILEMHRIRVEIDLASNVSNLAEVWIKLKEYEHSLNLNNLIYMMAHPSSLRRLIFSWREHLTDNLRRQIGVGWSYGHSSPATNKGDIYISELTSNMSESQALQWVIKQLEAQGIEVERND